MIQVAAAVEALLRQGRDPVTWKYDEISRTEIPWRDLGVAWIMWSIFHDVSCCDYGGVGLQSLFESLFFHMKKGSPYFWVSRLNFKALGSLCFTSFGHFWQTHPHTWYTHHVFFFLGWGVGFPKRRNVKPSSSFSKFASLSSFLRFAKTLDDLHLLFAPNPEAATSAAQRRRELGLKMQGRERAMVGIVY